MNIYNSKDAFDDTAIDNTIQSPAGFYFAVLVLSAYYIRVLCAWPIKVGALRFRSVVAVDVIS